MTADTKLQDPKQEIVEQILARLFLPDNLMPQKVAESARRRSIPMWRLKAFPGLVEFGMGSQKRRMISVTADNRNTISVRLTRDKLTTKFLLHRAGLPVPEGPVVTSAEEALLAANDIGYPVVIKPLDASGSRGAFNDIDNDDALLQRFSISQSQSKSGSVLVERLIPGAKHKATIINGKLACIYENRMPRVIGDGIHTIQELIDRVNDDPRRAGSPSANYLPLAINETTLQLLQRAKLTLASILPHGQVFELQSFALIRHGATLLDRTSEIHPANVALLEQAAHIVGLPVATIDVMTTDIRRPLAETDGAIIEINSESALSAGYQLFEGPVYDFGAMCLTMLFPNGSTGHIPVIAITESTDSQIVCQSIAEALQATGLTVGLSTRSGVTIDKVHHSTVEFPGLSGLSVLLNNPHVDAAIVEIDESEYCRARRILPYCDLFVLSESSGELDQAGNPVEWPVCQIVADNGGRIVINSADRAAQALSRLFHDHVVFYADAEPQPVHSA